MEREYIDLKNETYNHLMNNRHIVLATSSHGRVTARTISYIVLDNKIMFQTDSTFLKAKQIKSNNKVALCIDNIQIEGIAKILGNPFDEYNNKFLKKYKQIHESAYNKYSHTKNEIVIEVCPILITIWKYENELGIRKVINLESQTLETITMNI